MGVTWRSGLCYATSRSRGDLHYRSGVFARWYAIPRPEHQGLGLAFTQQTRHKNQAAK